MLEKNIAKEDSLDKLIESKNDSIQSEDLDSLAKIYETTIDSLKSMITTINNHQTEIQEELFWGMPVATAAIVISSIITIGIFGFGYFLNWLKNQNDKRSESDAIKTMLTVWIDLLKSPVLLQSKNSRDFAQRLRKSTELDSEKFSLNLLMANKLQSIEFKELTRNNFNKF